MIEFFLFPLAAVGLIGVMDVLLFKGQIGVKLSGVVGLRR